MRAKFIESEVTLTFTSKGFRCQIFWYQCGAWLLGLMVVLVSVLAWGDDLNWRFSPFSTYLLFPVLGLAAYGLMWSHYVMGTVRDLLKLNVETFRDYFRITAWAVLVLICLHPGLLIYQRFRDGFGLPPGSYESYVAPGLGWITILGTASLFVFLAYELWRLFGEKTWWHYIQEAGDLAMLAIFYHGLRLGTQISHGWFRYAWWLYGITLAGILVRSYTVKYLQYRTRNIKARQ